MRDTVEEFYSTCKPEDDLTDPRAELALMRGERDSESRWAAQYKAERDELRECCVEMLDMIEREPGIGPLSPCDGRVRWRRALGRDPITGMPNAAGEVRRDAVTSTGLLADESKGDA